MKTVENQVSKADAVWPGGVRCSTWFSLNSRLSEEFVCQGGNQEMIPENIMREIKL